MLIKQYFFAKCFQKIRKFGSSGTLHITNLTKQPRPLSDIPQPNGLPVLGTLLDLRNFDPLKLHRFLENRHKTLGTIFKESLITSEDVFTSAPEDLESYIRLKEKWPKRIKIEPFVRGRQLLNLNEGIANAQGEEWLRVRKLYNKHLLTNKSIWMYTEQHFDACLDLIDYMEKNFDENREVPDLENALKLWALECATIFATDKKMGVFKPDFPDNTKLFIDSTLGLFALYGKLTFSLPLWKYFNTKDVKELKKNQNNQINSMNKIFSNSSTGSLSRFQSIVAKSDLKQSEKDVVFTDILGAGIDTTSNATSFVLYCLAANPDKQEKLRQEINHFKRLGQEITGKTLQQMKYLHAVNMEAQRLYPLIIGTPRTLSSDMILSGYRVPAGTSVFFTGNVVNNRDSKYFENPDNFIPERWLKRNQENKFVMSGSFGMGARMCPGRRFAMQEIGCLAIALLSRYRIEYHHEPFEITYQFVSKPEQNLKFKFTPIKNF